MHHRSYFKKLERQHKQQILVPLGIDETDEWCNSFVVVPKLNGIVRLYLDLEGLKQALIWPIYRGETLQDITLKLKNVHYMTLIYAS